VECIAKELAASVHWQASPLPKSFKMVSAVFHFFQPSTKVKFDLNRSFFIIVSRDNMFSTRESKKMDGIIGRGRPLATTRPDIAWDSLVRHWRMQRPGRK